MAASEIPYPAIGGAFLKVMNDESDASEALAISAISSVLDANPRVSLLFHEPSLFPRDLSLFC